MTSKEVYEKLTAIFRDTFDDESIELTASTSPDDIEDWDSLEQIALVLAVQETFGIRFSIEEASGMKSAGDMADMILKKTAQ